MNILLYYIRSAWPSSIQSRVVLAAATLAVVPRCTTSAIAVIPDAEIGIQSPTHIGVSHHRLAGALSLQPSEVLACGSLTDTADRRVTAVDVRK